MKQTIFRAARMAGRVLSLNGRVPLPQAIMRRAFRHADSTVRVHDFDGELTMDLVLSEHMQRRIFWMGYYNRDIVALLDMVTRKGMTVIDVGANIGEITLVAARRVGPNGRVLAFEPMPAVAKTLQTHLDLNRLSQVTVVREGLADRPGSAQIFPSSKHSPSGEQNWGLNTLYGQGALLPALGTIALTTLDAYLEAEPVQRVDIVKIDIEGSELPCLKGARQTLDRFAPLLIIEIQKDSAQAAGYQPGDIIDYLREAGYRTFQRIGPRGRLSLLQTNSLADYQNVLCSADRAL